MSDAIDRLNAALEGRYEIERKLGEGGMASVYLAEDVKHQRKVALKVLRPELAAVIGGERFLAEITTTANLQHPHILALFDSGEADGYLYYVMPYIDGETLQERIARERQLGIEEAVRIARDVADALDYAHRAGVIHRDIKPANILLHDGRPVVADFGIALAVSAAGGGRMTETGLSLGTPHYMSPEQASADRDLSPRSDVYSLGCVLYEMIAGQPPHTGPSAQSILVRILTDPAKPLTELRHTVPPHIAAAVAKSIEKLPADRFDTAKQFRDALDDTSFTYRSAPATRAATAASPAVSDATRPAASGGGWLPWAAAAGFAALAAWGWLGRTPAPASPGPAVYQLDVGVDGVDFGARAKVSVSANGQVFVVERRDGRLSPLYVRAAGDDEVRALPGTEDGVEAAVSSDGQWIVYLSDGVLWRVAASGSAPLRLVTGDGPGTSGMRYPRFESDGSISYTAPLGVSFAMFSVPASGGVPEVVSDATLGIGQRMPGGRSVIGQGSVAGGLQVVDLETGEVSPIVEEGVFPLYVDALGAIVFAHPEGGLFAQRYDPRRSRVVGGPLPLRPGVSGEYYSVSETGTLVYRVRPGQEGSGATERRLILVDAESGQPDTIRIPNRAFENISISPDGDWLAYADADDGQIHLYDLARRSGPTQFTFDGRNIDPTWSPGSDSLAFMWASTGTATGDLFVRPVEGEREPLLLASGPLNLSPHDWTDDGIIIDRWGGAGTAFNVDLMWLDRTSGGELVEFVSTEFRERLPSFSPAADWVAYESNVTGRPEIFVREFPSGRNPRQITSSGGVAPVWSPTEDVIYYHTDGTVDTVFAVPLRLEPTFEVGEQRPVFTGDVQGFEVHPDGRRILVSEYVSSIMAVMGGEVRPESFVVVLNWFDEVRAQLEAAGVGN